MTEKGPRHDDKARTFRVSQDVRARLLREQTRHWRRAQRGMTSPRRYWVRQQRAFSRNLIRGDLVAHRRMFGISHKHVQPGQTPAEQGG
ncbi:MAG: hypothetical protein Kow0077_17770 [Anaerolineae bacterium]